MARPGYCARRRETLDESGERVTMRDGLGWAKAGVRRVWPRALIGTGLATLAAIAAGLVWVAIAGGVQPYETYEAVVARDQPAAQFPFNDASGSHTLADAVGSGSPTAENNGIALGEAGPFPGSQSGSFAGTAFASLSGDPLLDASSFSAEAWVDWAGGSVTGQPVFELGSSSSDYLYLTPYSSASKHPLLFEIHTSSNSALVKGKSSLTSGGWNYLTVTETASGSTDTLLLYLNGALVGETTGATLTPASLGTSVPDDYLGRSIGTGEPFFSGSISNVAFYDSALTAQQVKEHYDDAEFPVNTGSPTISGAAKEGSALSATEGTWTGLAPIKFAFQWEHCQSGTCATVSKATKAEYTPSSELVGQKLEVTVTASNAAGERYATSAQTATVEGKPANTALPTISGEAKVGQELTAGGGSWRAFPPAELSYLWEACKGKECAKAEGSSDSSGYRIPGSALGKTLRVAVAAKNSLGEASATSAATAKVVAGPPVSVSAPAISGTPREGQTLSATSGAWAGSEPIEYTNYAWQRCKAGSCSPIAGASGAKDTTYVLTSASVGYTIEVLVTAKNSAGETDATSAPSAEIGERAPESVTAPTISGEARDGHTLSSSTGTWSGGTPLSYSYSWEICNGSGAECQPIAGATGASLSLTHSQVGETVRVSVTAENSGGSATSASHTTSVVAAEAPAILEAPTLEGEAVEGHSLRVSSGNWAGTPPLSFSYQWETCNSSGGSCSAIAGALSSSYLVGASEVGDTIRVTVTAENSAGQASSASSHSAPVTAQPPSDTTLPTISGVARVAQTVTASTGAWAGRAPITYTYQWQECNVLGETCLAIAGATESTYTPSAAQVGDTLRVAVTATNVASSATATSEATAAVLGETGCSETWTGPSEGAWSSAANWSDHRVPGAADTVCIPAASTVRVSEGNADRAGVLDSDGTLAVEGGTLELARGSAISKAASIVQSRGELIGPGDLDISGSLTWTGGGEAGSGTTVLEAGADATVTYGWLAERRFVNEGTLVLAGTIGSGWPWGTLVNRGALEKGEGSGTSLVDTPFENEGTVSVTSGTLEMGVTGQAGEHPGTWEASAGAAIAFGNGEYDLGAKATFVGNVTINNGARVHVGQIEGANAQLTVTVSPYYSQDSGLLDVEGPATSTIGTLDVLGARGSEIINTATLTGAGNVQITKAFDLGNFAYLEGTGTTTVMPGADGVVSGQLSLQQRTLANAGTLTIEEGAYLGGEAHFDNTGTVAKTHGEGTAQIAAPIDNEGLVKATAGTLELTGGGSAGESASGSWQGTEGARVVFNSRRGPFALGSSVSMIGSVEIAEGTVTAGQLNGSTATVTVNGADQWEPGTLELTGAGASTLEDLNVAGGTLTGSAQLDVTGAFAAGGRAHLAGAGSTVIEPGATGSIGYTVELEERTLENAGTLTVGENDRLDGSKHARLVNSGTLNLNANSPVGTEYGLVSVPGEATLINTGLVEKVEGGEPGLCSFAIDNDGTVEALSGGLEFTGGGESAGFAADSWTAAPGVAIELLGISSNVEYDLGASATISGTMHLDANVTAGAIEGTGTLTTLHSILTLTSLTTPSEIGSLTFLQAPPDVWFPQVQHVAVASELDIDNSFTWSSYSAVLEGPGAIVTKPGSTTAFEVSATFDGGKIVNEGTATWEAGQLDDELDEGTFFVNRGIFQANAQQFEPLVQGCHHYSYGTFCPVFENDGLFTADLPHRSEDGLPVFPHDDWRVDILNKGELDVGHWAEPECPPWEYSEAPGPRVEACYRSIDEYEGLLLQEGAAVNEPPHNLSAPTVGGEAEEGQTLTANPGVWRGSPPPSYSYQWQHCGRRAWSYEGEEDEESWLNEVLEEESEADAEECTNIAGATGSTFTVGYEQVGYRLRVVVTAANPFGSASADSDESETAFQSEEAEEAELLEGEWENEEGEGEEGFFAGSVRPLVFHADASSKDSYRDTATGNVTIPAVTIDGELRPALTVHISAQVSLNGRQARVSLITNHPEEAKFIALRWKLKSVKDIGENPKTESSTIREPLNSVKFNLYLISPGWSEIVLEPEYARPNALRPGAARVSFRTIECTGGSECRFPGE
jgi:hypothetical protein